MDLTTTITALLTLAVFSFLYGDNPAYKFVERLLVGLAIGYSLVIAWTSALLDRVYTPLFSEGNWWTIIPLVLGLLMFSRFSRRYSWLSGIPLAAMIGAGAGAALPAMLEARILKQISSTVGVLADATGWPGHLSALVVVIGFMSTLSYFYFGRERRGALGTSATVGTYFLMVFFGATIGYTVMSRMSILIGRLDFLLSDWLGIIG